MADNRFPVFVGPICAAARRRGLRVVLDADKRTVVDDPLLRIATHVVFSSECLIATAGCADLAEGLRRVARYTDSFLAVSNGPNDILFLEESLLRRVPVFAIHAVDTLGAGAALHGGFALALAEGRGEAAALRFAAAVARLGGSAGLPTRAEVDAFMTQYDREAVGRRGEADSRSA
jgi:sulfofructose kinase